MSAYPAEALPPAHAIDPITFEVIRHKLQAITEEQAITLKSVSGSPVVTDATDFNNGLYLADGSIVTMGPQVIFHTGTMSTVIRSIIENFEENPGIRDGDMFVLNDPYRGRHSSARRLDRRADLPRRAAASPGRGRARTSSTSAG